MTPTIEMERATSYATMGPGTWSKIPDGGAFVACGFCGETASLADHTIADDGAVTPSLVCPMGCGWHVYARLKNWAE